MQYRKGSRLFDKSPYPLCSTTILFSLRIVPSKTPTRPIKKMKPREEIIAFEMNYCQHYRRGEGVNMVCKAGMDLKTIKHVKTGDRQINWGPCIEGHTLPDPKAHCPHWVRRTREMGEARADIVEKSEREIELAMPVVFEWRKKPPFGKVEIIECPVCKGRLHLSQFSYNGHVHVRCETKDCLSWME